MADTPAGCAQEGALPIVWDFLGIVEQVGVLLPDTSKVERDFPPRQPKPQTETNTMTDSNPTQIEDHDAGICDARGRRVGFQSQTWGSGKEFVVCLQTTRNECEFGASQRLHYFATQHERQAWIEQTVTKRIAAAVKKFQTI